MTEQGGQPSEVFDAARRRLTSNMVLQRYLSQADYAADIAVFFAAFDAATARVQALESDRESMFQSMNDLYSCLSYQVYRKSSSFSEVALRESTAALGPAERLLKPWWRKQQQPAAAEAAE